MRFNVLSDSNWEAKLDHATRVFELWEFFEDLRYGDDLSGGITVVLMCRAPELEFKQRIRLSKKDQRLYMDVMLDLPSFVNASHSQRRQMVASNLLSEVPRVVAKYRFKSFDIERFTKDLHQAVARQLLGADAARFDHLCLERATGF